LTAKAAHHEGWTAFELLLPWADEQGLHRLFCRNRQGRNWTQPLLALPIRTRSSVLRAANPVNTRRAPLELPALAIRTKSSVGRAAASSTKPPPALAMRTRSLVFLDAKDIVIISPF